MSNQLQKLPLGVGLLAHVSANRGELRKTFQRPAGFEGA